MSYVYLVLAILLEVSGTLCMKASDGFTRLVPSVLMGVFYALCFAVLTLAVKKLDIGFAYAVWSGLGTALVAVAGVVWFHEPMSFGKAVSLLLIVAGVAGLRLSGGGH